VDLHGQLSQMLETRLTAVVTLRARSELGLFGGPLCRGMDWLLDLLKPLEVFLAGGGLTGVRIAARPDQIDGATLPALLERGVCMVELSIPSLADGVLERMGPVHSRQQVARAVAALDQFKVPWGATIRPGMPGAYKSDMLVTCDRLLELRPSFVRVNPILVLKGTWLEQFFLKGRYVPLTLTETISICGQLLNRFGRAGVPVARMGMQPMRDLKLPAGTIVAGPFHPSLRTLVESELMYTRVANLLRRDAYSGCHARIAVSPGSESHLRGPENSNLRRLQSRFPIRSLSIRIDQGLLRHQVAVQIFDGWPSDEVQAAS